MRINLDNLRGGQHVLVTLDVTAADRSEWSLAHVALLHGDKTVLVPHEAIALIEVVRPVLPGDWEWGSTGQAVLKEENRTVAEVSPESVRFYNAAAFDPSQLAEVIQLVKGHGKVFHG